MRFNNPNRSTELRCNLPAISVEKDRATILGAQVKQQFVVDPAVGSDKTGFLGVFVRSMRGHRRLLDT